MAPNVRIYETEEAARDVADRLIEAGFPDTTVIPASEATGREAETVRSAVAAGVLPERQVQLCTRSLREGLSLVSAQAPFGRALRALDIMESRPTVKSDVIRRYAPSDPSPLSDAFGIPTLADFKPSTGLISSSWRFSSKFGLPLLGGSAAPLSSLFGLKTLTAAKKGWRTSFGLPLLSNNPAPLSSLFGMKTVSTPKKGWTTSFGISLLSNNPAPLSSLFSIKTLSKDR